MTCVMCELPIGEQDDKVVCDLGKEETSYFIDEGVYHKLCFDLAVASLEAQLESALNKP